MLKVFPVRREDLSAYDVVIFGDVNPSLLSPAALQNLADFVDHPDNGGALVLVAGPNFMPQAYRDTPLARLMPFDPAKARNPEPNKPLTDGFVVQPTEMGLASPSMQLGDSPEQSRAIWQKLPPLYWMTEVSDLKPSARVLAEHPTRNGPDGKRLPLIIMQYVGGGGKVLFHATDETYRWRRRVGDLYFARYWIQTLRFLTRSKLAEGDRSARLSTDRRDYALGDPVRVQVRFSDERLAPLDDNGVTVELEQIGRQTQKVQLHRTETGRGHFEAVLNNLPAGGYHAKMISPPLAGAGFGGRFRRHSAADRAGPRADGRHRDATGRRSDQGTLLYLQGRLPSDRRLARRPAGAGRESPARAALEPLAAAGVGPGTADRRMAAAEAEGDGVE